MPPSQSSGDQVYTVSELTGGIRELLEGEFHDVWVEGEISNFRPHSSGHQYFTLKDASAQLSCVFFRGYARAAGFRLEEGQQIQAFGDVSIYEARGQYQLVVRMVQPKGFGALQAKFEALKRKLDAEGLFDPARKRPIPFFPRTVAVVTSPTGAAVRDILNILSRRAPWLRVLIWPVRVQGAGTHGEIVEALQELGQRSGSALPRIDTVIVARGGGSIEDLWSFNEEDVARAIHACPIPVISAVGHEIDFTISDFVADLRAPTPSAAAELVAPDGGDLRRRLQGNLAALNQAAAGQMERRLATLGLLRSTLRAYAPSRMVETYAQELDYLMDAADSSLGDLLKDHQLRHESLGRLLQMLRPEQRIRDGRETVCDLRRALDTAYSVQRDRREARLESLGDLLQSLNPEAVLKRGFSITSLETGEPLASAEEAAPGSTVVTRLWDGSFHSVVEDAGETPENN